MMRSLSWRTAPPGNPDSEIHRRPQWQWKELPDR